MQVTLNRTVQPRMYGIVTQVPKSVWISLQTGWSFLPFWSSLAYQPTYLPVLKTIFKIAFHIFKFLSVFFISDCEFFHFMIFFFHFFIFNFFIIVFSSVFIRNVFQYSRTRIPHELLHHSRSPCGAIQRWRALLRWGDIHPITVLFH